VLQFSGEEQAQAFSKGALEAIAQLCRLGPEEFDRVRNQANELACEGMRVLAVARAPVTGVPPASPCELPFEYLGLLAFADQLRERTILTDNQRESLQTLGNESLALYYAQRLEGSKPVLHAIEREYRAHLGDIPLKGKIDRIDVESPTSAKATVIDYKAGKGKSESEIRAGDHFRQLAFYALLLESGDPLLKPEQFVLDYLGERGEHPIQRAFVVTDEEKASLEKLIKEVWAKILAFDFTAVMTESSLHTETSPE
jgi:hypothetical protein